MYLYCGRVVLLIYYLTMDGRGARTIRHAFINDH